MIVKAVSVFLIIVISSAVRASDIVHEMDCLVKSEQITSIQDGRVEQFSGFEDGLERGDVVKLRFNLDSKFCRLSAKMKLEIAGNTKFVGLYAASYLPEDAARVGATDLIQSIGKEKYTGMKESFGSFRFSRTQILDGDLILQRYFKDDWMGIRSYVLRTNETVYARTTAFDCKTSGASKLDEIYEFVIKVEELGENAVGTLCADPATARTLQSLIDEYKNND